MMSVSKLVASAARRSLPFLMTLVGLSACPSPDVMPLVGEDPEVARLLPGSSDDDPKRSPLAAARRLHQALMQDDADTVWTLLAEPTRRALDERGAAISASGRELIDRSMMPGPGGTMRTVRYETILFGAHVVDLREPAPIDGDRQDLEAVAEDGHAVAVTFVREADGWKLLKTGF